MKKIKLIDGELGPGFKKLLGGKVFLFCANYFHVFYLVSDVDMRPFAFSFCVLSQRSISAIPINIHAASTVRVIGAACYQH